MPDFRGQVTKFDDVQGLRASDTGKALLCLIGEEEVWIPQSQIDDESEVYEPGGEGVLVVSQWIAEEKGLV